MQYGDEIVNLESGIGYNSETEMISKPIPPQEVQEQILLFITTIGLFITRRIRALLLISQIVA